MDEAERHFATFRARERALKDDLQAIVLDSISKKVKERLIVCPVTGIGPGWGWICEVLQTSTVVVLLVIIIVHVENPNSIGLKIEDLSGVENAMHIGHR